MKPSFFIVAPMTRNGPDLQKVNPRAISYVADGGLRFEDEYPDGVSQLRAIAPPWQEGGDFVEATGLPFGVIYPEHGAEIVVRQPPRRRLWPVALGLAVGALIAWPLGAVVGAGLGGIAAWSSQ